MFSEKLFIIVGALSLLATVADGTKIIDLSGDFEVGNLDSSGAKKVIDAASGDRFLVLEKGKIVADYTSDDYRDDYLFNINSAQKGLESFAFGLLVDAGLLSLDDTLSDIFPNDSTWKNLIHADYLQGVSIRELLTLTSGLSGEPSDADPCGSNTEVPDDSCVWDAGGKDLFSALKYLSPNGERGTYNYVWHLMLYSYIFLELTGQGMREYMTLNVFPALGIDNDAIAWLKNSDGVDATNGMKLSAYDMAKFGQLYLQKGMSAPNASLISADWIEKSLTDVVPTGFLGYNYGYHWDVYDHNDDKVYCAHPGLGGQWICFYPELERVLVRQINGSSAYSLKDDFFVFERTTVFKESRKPKKALKKKSKKLKKRKVSNKGDNDVNEFVV